MSTPTRRTRSLGCALAVSGHAAARAEQGNELASYKPIKLHALPLARVAA